jgi:hypothetical protein
MAGHRLVELLLQHPHVLTEQDQILLGAVVEIEAKSRELSAGAELGLGRARGRGLG